MRLGYASLSMSLEVRSAPALEQLRELYIDAHVMLVAWTSNYFGPRRI